VDFGDGVARQLTLARLPFTQLRAAFLTHQHSDHNAGYGSLFLLAWASGLQAAVDVYGPPPLQRMTRLFLEEYEVDITTRMADEGRPPLAPLIRPHEVTTAGAVFADDRVKVTCALNEHPPIRHSFDTTTMLTQSVTDEHAVVGTDPKAPVSTALRSPGGHAAQAVALRIARNPLGAGTDGEVLRGASGQTVNL
jgi:ribonuclease BN (tRNA processing enzyme)